jgi:hypothetical protein
MVLTDCREADTADRRLGIRACVRKGGGGWRMMLGVGVEGGRQGGGFFERGRGQLVTILMTEQREADIAGDRLVISACMGSRLSRN